ncbi:phytoene/squalene synthetase [Litorimonas taeanensis]|uniref:Phytoene/squalene synthetase n=1 Tax=Litorimonas taeanensis TaxID=568099 RepID=A0A420WKJ4_9PROT|nr:squalene/phytoene synthase family protein [Litorimonas taeanensis]RKQ71528.1 phytoene/squalene synthetase [Litorimonas taeanensis]
MLFSLHQDVIARLEQADPDRYRSSLFAEPGVRERLILLYAFHLELARIPELVSEPMIGQIRYQWWRDVITEIYETETVRKHEITTPLRALFLEFDIPRYWVDQLIDGRERDIDPRPFSSLSDAQDYCAKTSGVLMKIAVKLCGVDPQAAVETMGTAWGLTGLARGYGFYHETMLREVTYERLCAQAEKTYKQGRSELKTLEAIAFPAIAYASLIGPYIAKLTHEKYDPKTQSISYLAFTKQIRLLKAVLSGRV